MRLRVIALSAALVLLCLGGALRVAAGVDLVTLRNGHELRGEVSIGDGAIEFSHSDGKQERIPWEQISELRFNEPHQGNRDEAPRPVAKWVSSVSGVVTKATPRAIDSATTDLTVSCEQPPRAEDNRVHYGGAFVPFGNESGVTVRVAMASSDAANRGSWAGLVLSESDSDEGAQSVLLKIEARGGASLKQWKRRGGILRAVEDPAIRPPYWLRLQRDPATRAVTGLVSRDGSVWREIGKVPDKFEGELFAGIAAGPSGESITAVARFEQFGMGGAVNATVATTSPRLTLRDGSIVMAPIESADERGVRLGGAWEGTLILNSNLAHIELSPPLPLASTKYFPEGRFGVVLRSGDFLQANAIAIQGDWLEAESVLFGRRKLSIRDEADAVVYRRPDAAGSTEPAGSVRTEPFTVSLTDGSVIHARLIEASTTAGRVKLATRVLGALELNRDRIDAISRLIEPKPAGAQPFAAPAVAAPVLAPAAAETPGWSAIRPFGAEGEDQIHYYLFTPEASVEPGTTKKKFPLVVWLHGGLKSNGKGGANIVHDAFYRDEHQAKNPCFCLRPVAVQGQNWVSPRVAGTGSHTMPAQPSSSMRLLLQLLDEMIQRYPIDERRVYVAGASMGGYGVWDLIQRHPEKFAAAMPICGAGDPSLAGRLKNLPLWIVHGEEDRIVPVKGSRDMFEAVMKARGENPVTENRDDVIERRSADGSVRHSEYKGGNHNAAWDRGLASPKLFDWFFKQSR